jgi:hypothetical protein
MAGGDHPMCAFDLALLVSLFWLEFKVIIPIFRGRVCQYQPSPNNPLPNKQVAHHADSSKYSKLLNVKGQSQAVGEPPQLDIRPFTQSCFWQCQPFSIAFCFMGLLTACP